MTKTLCLTLCLLLETLPGSAQTPCLKYEPEVVELTGKIKKQTFPGPPNYESVKNGDRPETYWILHLTNKICVEPVVDSIQQNELPERNVSQLQLTQVDYRRFRNLVGKRVRVRGRLIHAITGHHHTPVMLEALTIEPAT